MAGLGPEEAPRSPRSGVDPLSSVEREALTKIRQHESAVNALRDDVASLREQTVLQGGSVTVAELRRVTEEADRVETLLGVPREILARDALAKVSQWPSADLFQARAVLAAVDACEEAAKYARKLINVDADPLGSGPLVGGPESLVAALANILDSWNSLGKAVDDAKKFTNLVVGHVDMTMKVRASAVRPVADALVDKTVEWYRDLKEGSEDEAGAAAFGERLRALLAQRPMQDALVSLGVEVPVLDDEQPEVGRQATAAEEPPSAAGLADDSAADDPLLRTTPGIGGLVRDPSASAEMWHALHVGDKDKIEGFVNEGRCNARQRDASGHSVFWHAIAFNHLAIAKMMLDTFPPNRDDGVEVSEVHPRKGDTLLHLMCQSQSFGEDMAHVFKRVAAVAPAGLFLKVNGMGLTFLQLAASSLNFWVLTFMLRNFQDQARALVCNPSQAPLRGMARLLPQPSRPALGAQEHFPPHFRVAEMLQPDDTGVVPYADVAFDVGPEGGVGRFLAHRIVVVAQSPVLLESLEKLPLTELPREKIRAAVLRIDPRISQEVWRSALQFMYTGVVSITYADNVEKVVELLRACVLYQLPRPLLDAAQSRLYPLLPGFPPQVALQVFSITSGSGVSEDPDLRPAREASAHILIRSAHTLLEDKDPGEACQILLLVVRTMEHAVFHPATTPGAEGGSPPQQAQQGVAHDILSQSLSQSMRLPQPPWHAGSPCGSGAGLPPLDEVKPYVGPMSGGLATSPASGFSAPAATAAFGAALAGPLGSGQVGVRALPTAAFGLGQPMATLGQPIATGGASWA